MINPEKVTFKEYMQLATEVETLYEAMMKLHYEKVRDAAYANARAAYMEKRNLLQQVAQAHPEYLD